MTIELDRRALLAAGAGLGFSLGSGFELPAGEPIYLADMHRHLFFNRLASGESIPLGAAMASGNATLVAWALITDLLWIAKSPRGIAQKSVPKPGESFGWFHRELARIKQHLAEQRLKAVQNASDVEAALRGTPHVVLSTEGTFFLEDDVARIQNAYELGIRHIQLVHFTRNPVADFQTEHPEHNGLTDLGRNVIAQCNRLGILVDVAHCTEQAVDQALEISKTPVVWSHSSITRSGTPNWTMTAWRARQLTLGCARRIAAKGGVVGLWGLRVDIGNSIESYADRLLTMADQIGDDHVGFGTDTTAIPTDTDFSLLLTYADVRKVVERWQRKGVRESRIRKIAIENYARVLQQALQTR